MRSSTYGAAVAAVLALAAGTTQSASAALVGAGAWGSRNVTATTGCTKVRTGGSCTITADSTYPAGGVDHVGCRATNTVTGVDSRCRAVFTATLALTGEEHEEQGALPLQSGDYDIQVGACAGLTLSGAQVQIHDPELGDWVVYPRVVVSTAAWKIDGSLVAANIGSGAVTVLHVTGTIKPGCVRAMVRRGETGVTFRGVFNGSYQFL